MPVDRFAAVVDAAARVFITHGYQRAQIQDVANALRLGKGTLYGYAQGKAALFAAAVRYADGIEALPTPAQLPVAALELTRALSHPDRAITPDQVAGELAGIVADLYRRLSCHRVAIKLVDRCAPELPDLAQVWFGTARTAQVGAMQEYLTRRHDTGTLTLPGPVDLVARTVVELCALWAVHCHFDPAPTPPGVPPGASPFDDATVAATLAAFITRATTPRPAARSETPA